MIFTLASLIVTCVMCYGSFYLLRRHVRRRRLYELASRFTGPPALPILGNTLQLLGDGEQLFNCKKEWDDLYPSPYRFWIGPALMIVITDPVQVREVLLNPSTLGKGELILNFARPLLGAGILMAPESVLGVNTNAQTDKNCRYPEALNQIIRSLRERFITLWLHPDFIFNRTKLGRETQRNLKYIHDFSQNIIETKRNELRNNKSHHATPGDYEDDAFHRTPNIKASLHHLLSSLDGSSGLSEEELRDEVNTMIIAGHDTSAIVLNFTILMLASHPDVQDKVYEELYEIYGDADIDDRPVKFEDLVHMKYLERMIKESLRLFPVAPFIIREMSEEIDVGEHTFPRGSNVVIRIFSIHRREEYWPDPLKFDPDRFLPEESAKRHPYAYIPFSIGPRNCIGHVYAMMTTKTLLATVLRRYVFKKDNPTPIKDIRLGVETLLNPVEPITVRIERRTRN